MNIRRSVAAVMATTAMLAASASAAHAEGPTPETVNDPNVIGYTWTALDSSTLKPLSPAASMTIAYGNILRGNDGCNDFWGLASVDGYNGNITFHVQGQTRMECLVAPKFDVAKLEGTHMYYTLDDKLTLFNDDHTVTKFQNHR